MLTTAMLQTLAPGTAGLVTNSPHHTFIIAANCPLVVSWMEALPASGGGKWGHGHTTHHRSQMSAVTELLLLVMTVCYIISWGHIGRHPEEPGPVAG